MYKRTDPKTLPTLKGRCSPEEWDVRVNLAACYRLFAHYRWTDLIRTGDAVALLGIDPFQQLFPIPQSELDVAPNLEQNPGY